MFYYAVIWRTIFICFLCSFLLVKGFYLLFFLIFCIQLNLFGFLNLKVALYSIQVFLTDTFNHVLGFLTSKRTGIKRLILLHVLFSFSVSLRDFLLSFFKLMSFQAKPFLKYTFLLLILFRGDVIINKFFSKNINFSLSLGIKIFQTPLQPYVNVIQIKLGYGLSLESIRT